jgi:hypothetical protein
MTFLAYGNSAGGNFLFLMKDYFANEAVAKSGLGLMAATACFASPLFNILVGFGIGLIKQC